MPFSTFTHWHSSQVSQAHEVWGACTIWGKCQIHRVAHSQANT